MPTLKFQHLWSDGAAHRVTSPSRRRPPAIDRLAELSPVRPPTTPSVAPLFLSTDTPRAIHSTTVYTGFLSCVARRPAPLSTSSFHAPQRSPPPARSRSRPQVPLPWRWVSPKPIIARGSLDHAIVSAPRVDGQLEPHNHPAWLLVGRPVDVTRCEHKWRNSRASAHDDDLTRARSRTRCGTRWHPSHAHASRGAWGASLVSDTPTHGVLPTAPTRTPGQVSNDSRARVQTSCISVPPHFGLVQPQPRQSQPPSPPLLAYSSPVSPQLTAHARPHPYPAAPLPGCTISHRQDRDNGHSGCWSASSAARAVSATASTGRARRTRTTTRGTSVSHRASSTAHASQTAASDETRLRTSTAAGRPGPRRARRSRTTAASTAASRPKAATQDVDTALLLLAEPCTGTFLPSCTASVPSAARAISPRCARSRPASPSSAHAAAAVAPASCQAIVLTCAKPVQLRRPSHAARAPAGSIFRHHTAALSHLSTFIYTPAHTRIGTANDIRHRRIVPLRNARRRVHLRSPSTPPIPPPSAPAPASTNCQPRTP
ncbi:hypothetical protein POSPLADRAFT_1061619 [Postia placenta MAD-698-R-SB12]|uniref:Uncharacterized protein n=1 Tax=Postia placenta MAD-698-R-SB12 TaxID=670580 RepID=A0A1X6MMK2_9APHY|nr:hypothetical protein POSPLADRAFT_1061619 [Postia placenta MAD-698-R-SB12]OSX57412.1 hypothetical protein POSPLADRAFT_1061619 [Postia placenta MAD-698-R-SB12]